MKRKILISFWIACFAFHNLQAQIIQSAPKGNFVWVSPEASGISNTNIFRKSYSEKEYSKIGETTIPSSADEIEKRCLVWQKDFPDLFPLSPGDKARLLEMAGKKEVPKTSPLKYHPVAMGILGQVFYDKETPRGVKVSYKVDASGNEKIIEASLWPAQVKLPVAIAPQITESPNQITLHWEVKGEAKAEGFRVYRRIALKDEFILHKAQGGFSKDKNTWWLIINDTLVTPMAMYEYKIVTTDKLGNESERSEIARARTRGENVLPFFSELFGVADSSGNVKLQWKLKMPALARSVNVYRSRYFDKEFNLVARLSVIDTVYADKTVESNENQYYKLEVLMDEGSRTSAVISVLGKSNQKVEVPQVTSVQAYGDMVTVKWIPVPNTVNGYYVFTQTAIGAPETQVSQLVAPDSGSFTHKAIIIGNSYTYYYSVCAVGKDYKLSERSQPIEVMLRNVSKINSPTMNARMSDGKVILTWDDQFSNNENIMGYIIFRKSEGEKDFFRLASDTLNPRLGFFEDINVKQGTIYTYKLIVKDYFGASAEAITVLNVAPISLIAPQQLTISVVSEGVFLKWEQTRQPVKSIRVYAYEAGQKATRISELKSTDTNYIDKSVLKGKTYNYYVTYVDMSGIETAPGLGRSIKIK